MMIIALMANVLLLGFAIYTFSTDGAGADIWILALVAIVPILNIYVIRSKMGGDWISLWLQRKALEERKKIESINSHK